jgi:hypothetical protein
MLLITYFLVLLFYKNLSEIILVRHTIWIESKIEV